MQQTFALSRVFGFMQINTIQTWARSFNEARDYSKAERVTRWRKLACRIEADIYVRKNSPLESLVMINGEVVGAFLTLAFDA